MYRHHEESMENLVRLYRGDESVLAIVLGGSIAKGLERPDSDIDAIIVVTEAKYRALTAERRLSECVFGHCTYEKGYFDIKYCTKAYLAATAERGSEPSRYAFTGSRCLFARDPEIEPMIAAIPVFQTAQKAEKMLSFYSAYALNSGYFWRASADNPYLRHRAAAEAALFGLRLVLQEEEILFPCQKNLWVMIQSLPGTEALLAACEAFLKALTDEALQAYSEALFARIRYRPPEDYSQTLTRFIDDMELWWYKERPLIAEW